MYGRAPFKQILTHGFVVDGHGHKMSKSRGNVVAPQKVIDQYGVDILRLWVASTDYVGELAISDEILKRTAESYRRIRNTLRFLLSNLEDFDVARHAVADHELLSLDRYALSVAKDLHHKIIQDYYPNYHFHPLVKEVLEYCSEHLGAFYLDVLKDRLYTSAKNGLVRRSAQTALYHITHALLQWLAPILCFTTEEAWQIMHDDDSSSPIYSTWYEHWPDVVVDHEVWSWIERLRPMVTKAIEEQRIQGVIGSSLSAEVGLTLPSDAWAILAPLGEELRFVFLVSKLHLTQGNDVSVVISPSAASKCERCWHYVDDVGHSDDHPSLCQRCVTNISTEQGESRRYA
jgi:isoleucyl-tRNA synthetase